MGRFIMTPTSPLPPFTEIPAHLQSVLDYELQAQHHIAEPTWHYLQGGAMYEQSLQENQQQFKNIRLIPRHLKDLTQATTQLNLFGLDYPHPIFLAPVGHQALFHHQAEQATALAAQVMQSNLILSHLTNTHMADVNHQNPYKWFQLYWQGDRAQSLNLIKTAEQHDYKAIVITVDAPHTGIRDRERKANFYLPTDLVHPHSPPHKQDFSQQHSIFQTLMRLAPVWEDIAWVVENTHLPVLLKGVLHPADAKKAVEYGVAGLVISNHGGRVLDGAIPPLIALQKIRSVVPEHYPLLIDGGIRRGSDIFKAIALGANAVLVGRPYIYGLATAGALGVAHVLKVLKEELEITMALMGTASINEINQDFIYRD